MAAAIQKRRGELRTELTTLEKQIYDLETSYLEETRDIGNIFSGWGAYVSRDKVKLKGKVFIEERLFSLSSVTSPAGRNEAKKAARVAEGGEEKVVKKAKKPKKVDNAESSSTNNEIDLIAVAE